MATEKAKKAIIWFFAIAIIAVAGLFILSALNKETMLPAENVLYYGEECPHCKNVEAFIEENKVLGLMNITNKEVWYNQTNKAEFATVIKYCEINPAQAGVPLFFTGELEEKICLAGDTPIIDFLKEELNISVSA